MSEQYYRYNTDDAPIDMDNDEVYDYVLEREALKELDNVGPKCVRDNETSEHFGNLKGGGKNLMKNILIVFLVIVLLYLSYSFLCDNGEKNLKPGKYEVRFSY